MIVIWLVALFYIIAGFLFQYHITDTHYLTFSFIIFTVIVLFFVLFFNYTRFFIIIYISFIVRIMMMLIDTREGETIIPHSGEDTENFYETGIQISNFLPLLSDEVYGGFYSKFLGLLFYMYGGDRIFAQFLNILITITAILIIIHVFRMLRISREVQFLLVVLLSLFPHSLIFSSILMRESFISITVVLSLYFFVRWFKKKERTSAVLSVIFIILGASFHTAVIGILMGYLFGFIFYKHALRRFKFSVESLVPFSIFAVVTTYMLVFPDMVSGLPIFNKVDQVFNDDGGLYETVTSATGNTAYLQGLTVNNLFQLLLYSPIKIIYFIASPMPWNIGNLNEFVGFILDGVFYLFALFIFIKNFNIIRERPILAILLISILAAWFIFGLAINNAGTALRHRFKFFYIIVVALGIVWDQRKNIRSTTSDKIKKI